MKSNAESRRDEVGRRSPSGAAEKRKADRSGGHGDHLLGNSRISTRPSGDPILPVYRNDRPPCYH